VVALRFADGSLAAIAYGSASPVAGKEWAEVSAGAHRVVIDDFRSAQADGRRVWRGRQDKGHRAHAAAFRRAVADGEPMPTEAMLAAMRATLHAAGWAGGNDGADPAGHGGTGQRRSQETAGEPARDRTSAGNNGASQPPGDGDIHPAARPGHRA
jgi:hypothetical protein